jgi:hypothetical protein
MSKNRSVCRIGGNECQPLIRKASYTANPTTVPRLPSLLPAPARTALPRSAPVSKCYQCTLIRFFHKPPDLLLHPSELSLDRDIAARLLAVNWHLSSLRRYARHGPGKGAGRTGVSIAPQRNSALKCGPSGLCSGSVLQSFPPRLLVALSLPHQPHETSSSPLGRCLATATSRIVTFLYAHAVRLVRSRPQLGFSI